MLLLTLEGILPAVHKIDYCFGSIRLVLILLAGPADGPGELVALGSISVGGADLTGIPGADGGQEDLHLPEVGVSIGEALHLLLISVTWGVADRQTDTQ